MASVGIWLCFPKPICQIEALAVVPPRAYAEAIAIGCTPRPDLVGPRPRCGNLWHTNLSALAVIGSLTALSIPHSPGDIVAAAGVMGQAECG